MNNDTLVYKKEILFTEYDDRPNPLKNKFYILGAFYRAFSKNNYVKVSINEYDWIDGVFVKNQIFSFTVPFQYTAEGYPVYGDYQ